MNLDDWDADFVLNEIGDVETASLEKKASAKFKLTAKQKVDNETKLEIAKQVSAFSNSRDGYLIFGLTDDNQPDEGIPARIGNQPIKEWFEQTIPSLLTPTVVHCEAKAIRLPHHDSDRCALVVAIPLSDSRPHWVTAADTAYIRAGSHSLKMQNQTLLDMSSRSTASAAEIISLGFEPGETINGEYRSIPINPRVRLINGPPCRDWGIQLETHSSVATLKAPYNVEHIMQHDLAQLYIYRVNPLLAGRATPVSKSNLFVYVLTPCISDFTLEVTLFTGTKPVTKMFTAGDLPKS